MPDYPAWINPILFYLMSVSNSTTKSDSWPLILNAIIVVMVIFTGGPLYLTLIKNYIETGSGADLYKLIVFSVAFVIYLGLPLLGAFLGWKKLRKPAFILGGIGVFNVILVLLFVLAFWGAGVFS